MAKYQITSPDGGTYEIEAPDTASQEQVLAYAKQNFAKPQQAMQAIAQNVAQRPPAQSAPSGFAQGLKDTITGPAQLLYNALPSAVTEAGDKINNYLADKGAPLARIPEGGLNKLVANQEQQYQAERKAAGDTGIDMGRIAGNVVSPANLAAGAAIPKFASLGNIGNGIIGGAAFGTLQPVTNGKDYWNEKPAQIGLGGVAGAALPAVTGAMARVIRPNTSKEAQSLLDEGVTPTAGQLLGGAAQKTEDKLQSIPILGDIIANARGKSLDEFNRAAYGRVLRNLPDSPQLPAEVGREGVAAVKNQLSSAYNALLPKLQFKPDAQFAADLSNLQSMAQNLAPTEAQKFNAILQQHLSKVSPNGGMTGETFKVMESALSSDIKRYASSGDAYQQELGSALKEALNVFRQGLERSNPQYAQELSAINQAYANYTRVRAAAGMQGSDNGKFTPQQLAFAVRSGDTSAGKGNTATGQALMQDLSDAGRAVLANKYPDSGTAGRAMVGYAGAGGLAAANPMGLGVAAAAALPYTGPGRQLAAMLLAKRPDVAVPIANAVRNTAKPLLPGAVTLANLLSNPTQ